MAERTSTDILIEDLLAHHASAGMIQQARAGYYNDYASPLAAPIAQLVDDARRLGMPAIAQRAMEGCYDGTPAEAEAWYQREGRDLLGGTPDVQ